jgi:prepilin-type N-terminal cleavage/methylation domain-containing protein
MKIYSQRRVSSFAGFTLIEMLVVMAIIAVLAGLLLGTTQVIQKKKIISRAQGQIAELSAAIDNYQSKKGFFPPDNKNNPAQSSLVYELWGATSPDNTLFTIDFGQGNTISSTALSTFFGVQGIMNSSPDKKEIMNFISNFKLDKVKNINTTASPVFVFHSPSKGPNEVNTATGDLVNLINYVSSSPKHNPSTYDLWIDVVIGGKTNRISNWSHEAEANVGPY